MGRFGWSKGVGVAVSLLLGGCGQGEEAEVESPWSAPEPVNDGRSEFAISPHAAAHPAGVHLVWTEGPEQVMTLRARHFDSHSGQWEETRDLGPVDADWTDSGPAVAADSAGNAVVVWLGEDEKAIRAARYDRETDRWSEPNLLDAAGNEPHVVMDADGSALAVWAHWEGDAFIYAAHMTPEGTWSRGEPIDTTAEFASFQTDVVLHADGDATAYVVQRVKHEDGYWGEQLAALHYVKDQDAWTAPVVLHGAEVGEYFDASLAGNAQGDAVLVWLLWPSEDGEPRLMYATTYDRSTSAWTEPERLTTIEDCPGALAMDSDGRTTWVCSRFKGRGSEISAIRVDDDDAFGAVESVFFQPDVASSKPAALALEDQLLAVWVTADEMHSSSFRDGGWQAPEPVGPARGGVFETGLVNVPDVGVLTYWTTTAGELVTSWHP